MARTRRRPPERAGVDDGRGASATLVTGGGTGGHVYPALAVADELVRRAIRATRSGSSARRAGSRRRRCPRAGYAIDLLPGSRAAAEPATAADWSTNVARPLGHRARVRRGPGVVRRARRPSVVVGVGGYASVPCVLAARLRRIPVVVHEQNAAPGLANRRRGAPRRSRRGVAARHAAAPVRCSPATRSGPRSRRCRARDGVDRDAAGVRRCVRRQPRRAPCQRRGARPGRPLAPPRRRRRPPRRRRARPRAVRVRCRRERARDRATRSTTSSSPTRSTWSASTRTPTSRSCRAGAVTVAELAAAGVPAVLVPLPGAPGDHQTPQRRGARRGRRGGGHPRRPPRRRPPRRDARRAPRRARPASRRCATRRGPWPRPDAAARVADLVEEVARARDLSPRRAAAPAPGARPRRRRAASTSSASAGRG